MWITLGLGELYILGAALPEAVVLRVRNCVLSGGAGARRVTRRRRPCLAGFAGGRNDRQRRPRRAIVSGRPVDLSSRVFRNARILIVDDEPVNVGPAAPTAGARRLQPHREHERLAAGARSVRQVQAGPDPARPPHAAPRRPGGDGRTQSDRRGQLSADPDADRRRHAGSQARSAVARREGLSQQAVSQRRSPAADRHAARDAVPLSSDSEPEPDPRSQGAGPHARARGGADRDHRAAGASRRVPRRQHRAAHRARRTDGGAAGARRSACRTRRCP